VRATALLIVLALLLAGCVEKPSLKVPSGTAGSIGRASFDNSTIQGRLTNSPHININSGMTLGWDFPNASKEKPGIGAALVQFLDGYKSSHHAFDGNFHVVAFVPVESTRAVGACGPQEKTIKSFLRSRDGGNDNRFGQLVGAYDKGWYHAVLVAFEPASFKISFDADKEARVRNLPAADPFVDVGGISISGGRELAHNVPAGGGVWLAWATAQVTGMAQDGGRVHKLDVGCQSAKVERTPGTGFRDNNVPAASAIGPSGAIDVKSVYTPTLTVTASTATVLNVGWVHLKPIPLDTAAAASKPS
jgi:hypothetical protein